LGQVRVKAIVLGALVDIVGSVVAGGILLGVWRSHGGSGLPRIGLQDAVGLAFSFLGGLVAARVARRREFLHAVASALPCLLLGLAVPAETVTSPLWHQVLSHAGIPFALLGGYCGRGWNRVSAD
jgi:hypothetical protein